MTELEERIRETLDDEARSAPPPHDASRTIHDTRRRQRAIVGITVSAVVVLVAASALGLGAVLTADRGTPADRPTTTTTVHGITIVSPASWVVADPDEAGLNGGPGSTLPRLVLALSPSRIDERFGCPGIVEGTPPTFLMTIQELPLALSGESSAPWPAELSPMNVDASGSGCYPGWTFLHARWTASNRTFEAVVGLSSDVGADDRQALLDAYASMTFAPAEGGATSALLWSGTTDGEGWDLIASADAQGLELTLQGTTFGTGMGGFDPDPAELQVTSHVIGDGDGRQVLLFGAVPTQVDLVEVVGAPGSPANSTEVLDVPDAIDSRLNAFLLVVDARFPVHLNAYDAGGHVVLRATVTSQGGAVTSQSAPTATPSPAGSG